MISTIEISGIGVIDRATLDFGEGLTVLTGETGAGKTMVLTSVNLLMGSRAEPALVREGRSRAQVDGVFTLDEQQIAPLVEEGIDVEDSELIVSRTVLAQGRSRAHVGGRMVPASGLAQTVAPLITVHGQAEQMRLKNPNAQRDLVDSYGDQAHQDLLAEYEKAWKEAVNAKRSFDDITKNADERIEETESLSAALEAIDAFNPHEGEDEELRLEARRLMSVEDLRRFIDTATAFIRGTDDTDGASSLLRQSRDQISSARSLDESLASLERQAESIAIDVETLGDDLGAYARSLDTDPARLAWVHSRRADLKKLLEGRADDASGLIEWAQRARKRLEELVTRGNNPEAAEKKLKEAQARVLEVGSRLHDSRVRCGRELAEKVTGELHALAMADAKLMSTVEKTKPTSHGLDDVTILLQPHSSATPRPLGQGASGGELSRIMLGLEVVLGEKSTTKTFIFDEVDAGIGGQTATEVGARLKRLAQNRQVIVVTHLPQVAVFASHHLVVTKNDGLTDVHVVEGEAREAELTRMMGGDAHSPAARRHAIEVLTSAVPQSQG